MNYLSGVVLAGGSSSRMGQDKATLRLGGVRLVDRAVAVLLQCCSDVVVAAGTRTIPDLEVAQIDDAVAGAGPLGGILAGLERAAAPLVAVLAVDLPHASAEVFADLAAGWAGEGVRMPASAGRSQPLHAVWAASAAPRLRAVVESGQRRVLAVAEDMGAVVVSVAGDYARNLNRPEDIVGW